MINLSFDLKDKKAARIFGQAMINYSGEDEYIQKAGRGKRQPAEDDTNRLSSDLKKPVPFVAELDVESTKGRTEVPPATLDVQSATLGPAEPPAPIHGGGTGEPEQAPTVDENGVEFNAEFCGKAKIPFYASGKRKGQWKRKQKLDENTYDAWYAAEHIKVQTGPATLVTPVAPDTAAAFGGTSEPEPVDDDAPTGAGELMKWISEQMNAGNLTQGDVDAGYATAAVTPADLFSGDTEAITKLYGVLTAVIAA